MNEKLLTAEFGPIWSALVELVQNPTNNVTASVLLLAAVSLVVLILLGIAILIIAGTTDDDVDGDVPAAATTPQGAALAPIAPAPVAAKLPRRPIVYGIALWMAIMALVWMVGGVVTSGRSLCISCHPDNPHAKVAAADPHRKTECVACHETGGPVGSITYMVPPRALHFVLGAFGAKLASTYGRPVASVSCVGCHEKAIATTVTVKEQGVRVSHREPLEAGAQCLECHALNAGIVSNRTVGMTPCLRCHDGKKVASDCRGCHVKDVGLAVRSEQPVAARTSRDLVGRPDCGGCHSQEKCDACHGMRMPHSAAFMYTGHARQGVQDLWHNGGKTCGKCHTATRRPCAKCHGPMPSHPTGDWPTMHQLGNSQACGTGCHGRTAYMANRDFCGLCHER
jgi:hypothetical protein